MSRLLDELRRRLNSTLLHRGEGWKRRNLEDSMAPRGDHLQLILKSRGEPRGAIYVDDTQEYRSPALQEGQADDAPTPHNP